MTDTEALRPTADPTRQRLLEAAEAEFAEKGFKAATVRDICRRAGANIAAVNYHFGDKERLYIETVKYAHRCSCLGDEPFPEWPPGTPPADKLRDFIRTMAQRMMKAPRPASLQLLMVEMGRPSEACGEVVRDYIQPIAHVLRGILQELMPAADHTDVFLTGFSIIGQILHYRVHRPVSEILVGGPEAFARFTADRVADHITRFTLAALGLGAPLLPHPVPEGRP